MAIKRNSDRQYPLVAVLEFTFADQTTPIVATPVIDLPANAVITGGSIEVVTAYAGLGASSTIDLLIDGTSLLSAAVDLDVAAGTGALLLVPGTKWPAANTIDLTIVGSGTATAGAVRVIVEYVVAGRGNENFG